MALRKVRIPTLRNQLIILHLRRTILEWQRFQWRIQRGSVGRLIPLPTPVFKYPMKMK